MFDLYLTTLEALIEAKKIQKRTISTTAYPLMQIIEATSSDYNDVLWHLQNLLYQHLIEKNGSCEYQIGDHLVNHRPTSDLVWSDCDKHNRRAFYLSKLAMTVVLVDDIVKDCERVYQFGYAINVNDYPNI